jgi:hypothetical protein
MLQLHLVSETPGYLRVAVEGIAHPLALTLTQAQQAVALQVQGLYVKGAHMHANCVFLSFMTIPPFRKMRVQRVNLHPAAP